MQILSKITVCTLTSYSLFHFKSNVLGVQGQKNQNFTAVQILMNCTVIQLIISFAPYKCIWILTMPTDMVMIFGITIQWNITTEQNESCVWKSVLFHGRLPQISGKGPKNVSNLLLLWNVWCPGWFSLGLKLILLYFCYSKSIILNLCTYSTWTTIILPNALCVFVCFAAIFEN